MHLLLFFFVLISYNPIIASDFRTSLEEVSDFIGATKVKKDLNLSGNGLIAVLIDSGIYKESPDFNGKTIYSYTFLKDDFGNDTVGHGTHLAGIICANGIHKGIAHNADLISLKIVKDTGKTNKFLIDEALEWVLKNKDNFSKPIGVINISLGNNEAYTCLTKELKTFKARKLINELNKNGIMVICASGNNYKLLDVFGVSYPAIIPEVISVGGVYNKDIGIAYYNHIIAGFFPISAIAFTTKPNQIVPFCQRLGRGAGKTDIFAPCTGIKSTGNSFFFPERIQGGTSQAAAIVSGSILLYQEYYIRKYGKLPKLSNVNKFIMGMPSIFDGDDDEDDNVQNSLVFYKILKLDKLLEEKK
jgi:serine protease AprX